MSTDITTSITPDDITGEVDTLIKNAEHTWFKPLNPLTEPVEPLDFIIEGFCARGMITVLGASPGAGKSIFVQYLFSKHNNRLLDVKSKAKAIYLTGADSSETELRRRARSIKRNDGLMTVETPDELYCTATNEIFMAELKKSIISGGYDALILDTIADYHEGSTYDAELVNKTMAIFRRFVVETDVSLILITHTKKGSKIKAQYDVEDISDSRIWTSKSDFVFAIRSEYQDDSTNLIELQNLKSRSPKPLQSVRANIYYSQIEGLLIEPTSRSFKSELEANSKDEKKLNRIKEAKRLREAGKSVREIADALGIAIGTVSNYLKADAGSD